MNRGNVILVRFPHPSGLRGKKRPAVVVQSDAYAGTVSGGNAALLPDRRGGKPRDVEQHLTAFVTAFVTTSRRDRWLEPLTQRGKNTFANSSKLMQSLDARYCVQGNGT